MVILGEISSICRGCGAPCVVGREQWGVGVMGATGYGAWRGSECWDGRVTIPVLAAGGFAGPAGYHEASLPREAEVHSQPLVSRGLAGRCSMAESSLGPWGTLGVGEAASDP